ncbi:hypothetical protein AJ79_00152 [Helicocarpus griseus UAMH5409]|uniref:chitinase n=1 Tax=Helicocarpus griseus UAMH5409 TaxID=1447875 RepID=A0A2B7YCD0_9EURO|nr:hypothetical protein AJ79_00152 [Helicocarpus griseus UAMH5409]
MAAKPVYLLYLASWRNNVPDLVLVSEVTHGYKDPLGSRWLGRYGIISSSKTEESRRLFSKNVKAVIDVTGIDGIDLDWEYPGGNGENYKEPGTANADKVWEIDAYPKLVAELRAALGPDKTLCAALPCVPRDTMAFDSVEQLARVVPHMDFFNLMTYDLLNRRDTMTGHHAGVEGSLAAVDRYLGNGMPAEKAVLGFAFFLKWFRTLPLKSHAGPIDDPVGLATIQMEDQATGADLGGTGAVLWSDGPELSVAASFNRAVAGGSYDERHGGHYYLDYGEDLFWTWEIPEAIKKKYRATVGERGLRGAFAWDLGGDSKDWRHLKALNRAIKGEALAEQKDS